MDVDKELRTKTKESFTKLLKANYLACIKILQALF
jgi:hypothetical protein